MRDRMDRKAFLEKLRTGEKEYDVIVIGGGATGLGIAVDAASRGFSTVLLEKTDFAKGTSSRSTKLAHGGVRYLAQGNIKLVLEALKERGLMRQNAPNMVTNQCFAVPLYQWWEIPFYFIGLKIYDLLSGKRSFGKSQFIRRGKALEAMPGISKSGLKGAILYHDGQFDDALLAVALAKTAVREGALVLNHAEVVEIDKVKDQFVLTVRESLDDSYFTLRSKTLFNATGVFTDDILSMENSSSKPIIAPSQGIHLVVDSSFWRSDWALMIPKTSDGRVLFGVPWNGKVLLGTTDTPVQKPIEEPIALDREIDFILATADHYLDRKPGREDVLSIFAGLRPLVAPREAGKSTKEISRGHKILMSEDKMITIIGGKWTTYRKMAEDAINEAIASGLIEARECRTKNLAIEEIKRPLYDEGKNEGGCSGFELTKGDIRQVIREEMACTIEDVLARRIRILFLDARAAIAMAPIVSEVLQEQLGDQYNAGEDLAHFIKLAESYLVENYNQLDKE
nr:glycerol-3-phosphate dehydrogenase/oxidase [Membranihabitans maritimus]